MAMNEEMLPLGKKKTHRTGDFIYTWEVVGWNEKLRCNIWAEVSQRYSPVFRPDSHRAIEGMKNSIEHEHAFNMARKVAQTTD